MADQSVVANAYVQIVPTAKGLTSAISDILSPSAKSAGESAGSSMAGGISDSVAAKIGVISGAFAAIGSKAIGAITDSVNAGITRLDTLESFKRVMTSLGESEEDATAAINAIKSQLDGLPTSTADIAAFAQQIKATGVGLTDATDYALAFNNAMLAGGKGQEAANSAADAYNKMLATGKPYMAQWLSLVRTAPAQMDQLAKSLLGAEAGQNDLYNALQDGTLSMDDFNKALAQLNKEGGDNFASFEEQARAATGGISTSLSLIGSRIGQQWYKIFDAIGQTNISGALNAFSSQFNKFGDIAVRAVEAIKAPFDRADFYDGLISSWEKVAESYQPILDALGEASEYLGQNLGAAFSLAGTSLGNLLGKVGEVMPDIIDKLSVFASSVVDLFATRLAGAFDILAAVVEPLSAAFEAVLTVMAKLNDVAMEVTDAFIGGLVDGLQNADLAGPAEAFTALGDAIFEALDAVMPYIADFAAWLGQMAGEGLALAIEGIGALAAIISENLGPAVEFVAGWITENLVPAIEAIYTWAIETLVPALEEDVAWAQENILPLISQAADFIMTTLIPAIGDLFAWLAENIQPIIEQVAAFIIEHVVPAFSEFAGYVADNVIPVLGDFFAWVGDNVLPVIDELAGFIVDTVVPAFMDLAGYVMDNVVPALQKVFDWTSEHVYPIFEKLGDILINHVVPAVKDAAEWLGEHLGPVLEDLQPIFEKIGDVVEFVADVIGGFLDGLSDGLDWLVSTVEGIPSAIDSVMNSIHIPSFHIDGYFNLDPFNFQLPTISFYAAGGWVDEPTLAMIGEGGAGEFVWPSENGYLERYADALVASMDRMGGGAGVTITDCTFNVREEQDIYSLAVEIDRRVAAAKNARF